MPLRETSDTRPLSFYAADKLACELHARVTSHLHGIPTVGLRLFNVYGPRQDPASPYSGVISIFADRLKGRQELTIFGDGRQVRDFVFVGDVVDVFAAAMTRHRPGAFVCNVCTGVGTTILALAGQLGEIVGATAQLAYAPARAGDVRVSIGDPRRLADAYGQVPKTPLRDGLSDLLRSGTPRPAAPRVGRPAEPMGASHL
jgi:UDP-glucose 4-epimerase